MADEDGYQEDGSSEPEEEQQLSDKQKLEIAKWFLTNSPPGEIQYVAKGFTFSNPILFLYFQILRWFVL